MNTDRLPVLAQEILLALLLLTRIPVPVLPDSTLTRGARAVWAYPVIGLLVGGMAAAIGSAVHSMGLPAVLAAGVVLGAQIILTGGLHEDGLADVADGFWGGADTAQRLEIMKDSRIGTYGMLAIMIVTGLRWGAYATLLPFGIGPLVVAAVLSRSTMPLVMAALPPARVDGLSRSIGQPASGRVLGAVVIALVLAGLIIGAPAAGAVIIACAGTAGFILLARAKIGGQTGDVLGAAQQISEVLILLLFAVLNT